VSIHVERVSAEDVEPLRTLHRAEMACQIVHDSLPSRGLSHCHRLTVDGAVAGYGCVVGFGDDPKDTVDELFVLPERRGETRALFRALVEATGARRIQAQTNDPLLTLMLHDFATDHHRDRLLFEDGFTTSLEAPGVVFRQATAQELASEYERRPLADAGDRILVKDDEIVAAGGILFHYNPPYGDLYMSVAEAHRRQGYGAYLVQELKRVCHEMGKVPAARCNVENEASRATLERAGMVPCGGIVTGTIVR